MRKILWLALLCLSTSVLFADESGDYYKDALDLYRGNHFQAAVQDLKLALQADPNNWKAHQLLGYCAFVLKDPQDTVIECQKSLELHKDNPRLDLFTQWLKAAKPGEMRAGDGGAYFEGREEKAMPPPPDLDPSLKADGILESLTVPTPTPKHEPEPFRNFLFQLGPGLEFPAQNLVGSGQAAWGGELGLGYALDHHWSFWLTEGIYFFPLANSILGYPHPSDAENFETTLSARYSFGEGPFQPYVGAGLGMYWEGGFGTTGPYHLLEASLGARLKLGGVLSAFVEGDTNFIFNPIPHFQYFGDSHYYTFTPQLGLDYPVKAGVILDFWGDEGNPEKETGVASSSNRAFPAVTLRGAGETSGSTRSISSIGRMPQIGSLASGNPKATAPASFPSI